MTYCIITVIYGVPLTEEAIEIIKGPPEERESDDDDVSYCAEILGFTIQYSGNTSQVPGYCGVELCTFDECTDGIPLSALKLKPNKEQRAQASLLIRKIPWAIKQACGRTGVYLIPSSS